MGWVELRFLLRIPESTRFLLSSMLPVTYFMIVFVKAENWSLLWAGPLAGEGERIQAARDRPQVRGKREAKEYVHRLILLRSVLRILDVYPGSDFFPSGIPDPGC